jgi:hypothetical protein
MNTREHFAKAFGSEKPKFVRVLRAVPGDQLAYRPHPRSTSAGDLIWLLATELGDACELADHAQVRFAPRPAPARLDESIAIYERNAGELEKRLERLNDAAWERPVRLLGPDGSVAWEAPLGGESAVHLRSVGR